MSPREPFLKSALCGDFATDVCECPPRCEINHIISAIPSGTVPTGRLILCIRHPGMDNPDV